MISYFKVYLFYPQKTNVLKPEMNEEIRFPESPKLGPNRKIGLKLRLLSCVWGSLVIWLCLVTSIHALQIPKEAQVVGLKPRSLFDLAFHKYVNCFFKIHNNNFILPLTEELSNSNKIPLAITDEILNIIDTKPWHRGNLTFLNLLLNKESLVELYPTLLDRITTIANGMQEYTPYNYFIKILSNDTINKRLANTLIRKYNLNLSVIASHLIYNNKHQQLKKLIEEFTVNFYFGLEKNDTLLHKAALSGNVECAKILIEKGSLINIKNLDNETPLDVAIKEKKPAIIAFLEEKGGVHKYLIEPEKSIIMKKKKNRKKKCLIQ